MPYRVGFVSLGCPKALVDSERIMTSLRSEGYTLSSSYSDSDVVVVNTCGFIDSARTESLEAIAEAIAENGRVIVTGCLGHDAAMINKRFPDILAVTGPHQYEQVVSAVKDACPIDSASFDYLVPPQGIKLTPRHYAYLKISEGCNHRCSFCIIPKLRGKLSSRPEKAIVREAQKLAAAGCRELMIIAQDSSAYGFDHQADKNEGNRSDIITLADALGHLGVWVRLHYVYPYPMVDRLIPMMADPNHGLLPYLDIPLQHSSPKILKAMRRPANQDRVLDQLNTWRQMCPNLALRSTFIVGFPGETEADFKHLLDWMEEAQLDRVGCFVFEPVVGAEASDYDDAVPSELAQERYNRFMEKVQTISKSKLAAKVGATLPVMIDAISSPDQALGRTMADAPEIDGQVEICTSAYRSHDLEPGDIVTAQITGSSNYDLYAKILES